jgi:hypothetical protein
MGQIVDEIAQENIAHLSAPGAIAPRIALALTVENDALESFVDMSAPVLFVLPNAQATTARQGVLVPTVASSAMESIARMIVLERIVRKAAKVLIADPAATGLSVLKAAKVIIAVVGALGRSAPRIVWARTVAQVALVRCVLMVAQGNTAQAVVLEQPAGTRVLVPTVTVSPHPDATALFQMESHLRTIHRAQA